MNRFATVLVLAAVCAGASATSNQADPPAAKELVASGKPLSYWINALKDSDTLVREEAVLVLTDLGPAAKDAVPALQTLLKDSNQPARVKAATALVRIDPRQAKKAVPVLIEGIKDASPLERAQLFQVLGQLGADAADACPTLIDLLNDPDSFLQSSARATLVQIGSPALPSLQAALSHKDAWVRRSAAETLRQMGPVAKDATPALKERLKDDDGLTRVAAVQARRIPCDRFACRGSSPCACSPRPHPPSVRRNSPPRTPTHSRRAPSPATVRSACGTMSRPRRWRFPPIARYWPPPATPIFVFGMSPPARRCGASSLPTRKCRPCCSSRTARRSPSPAVPALFGSSTRRLARKSTP